MNTLKIKKLKEHAIIPKYATSGAACFDLHAINVPRGTKIYSGAPVTFDTGLAFDIPEGFAMLIFSRSGAGFGKDTRLANCVGVIDSDYTGEVKVKLTRDSSNSDPLEVNEGDRIAQALMVRAEQWEIVEVDDLKTTERGAGGFGSTGAA